MLSSKKMKEIKNYSQEKYEERLRQLNQAIQRGVGGRAYAALEEPLPKKDTTASRQVQLRRFGLLRERPRGDGSADGRNWPVTLDFQIHL
jgi:hypothetical protein